MFTETPSKEINNPALYYDSKSARSFGISLLFLALSLHIVPKRHFLEENCYLAISGPLITEYCHLFLWIEDN